MNQIVIMGGGLAGLTAALSLFPLPVLLLSPYKLGEECSSAWAQGGVAAAVGDDDQFTLHATDTLKAGAGLCDQNIVDIVTREGADSIQWLMDQGTAFDCDKAGKLTLGLEAAHSRRRIVHAAGDGTGRMIVKALTDKARATPSITLREDAKVTGLITDDDGIAGIHVMIKSQPEIIHRRAVILATGGAGALWQQTTNPLGSWGHGVALAARAGAQLADLEFMQFHPTAMNVGRDPMPLASEALRGEGAVLIDETGERFTDELQPRDIVTRAIWKHQGQGHQVFLDARQALGHRFAQRFPAIDALCKSAGIDPALQPMPVHPAAHYYMGGVVTDDRGRTTVKGLWACGEVACTGLHGANRLASNSLLEAAVFGRRVAKDIKNRINNVGTIFAPKEINVRHQYRDDNLTPQIRSIMSKHLGVLRYRDGMLSAILELQPMSAQSDMALVAYMMAAFAARREESRGAHFYTDFPEKSPLWARRQIMTLDEVRNHSGLMTKVIQQPVRFGT